MTRRLVFRLAAATFAMTSLLFAGAAPRGLDGKVVTVWRYWEKNYGRLVEKMMILNNEETDLMLTLKVVRESPADTGGLTGGDSLAGSPGGPWMIPAKNFSIINAPPAVGGSGDLLQFQDDQGRILGTLSLHSPLPPDTTFRSGMITTEGLNGGGGPFDHCWWRHQTTILRGGDRDTVVLHLLPMPNPSPDEKNRRVILIRRDTTSALPLKLIGLESEGLKPGRFAGGVVYVIPWEQANDPRPAGYSVTFIVEAPEVTDPFMVELPLLQQARQAMAGAINLPMLAVP